MENEYQVIEDNGGGLTLVVFDGEIDNQDVIYVHTGYEFNEGQLSKDISELEEDSDDMSCWEGCELNAQSFYNDLTSSQLGWQVVVEKTSGELTYYPYNMGASAECEFAGKAEKTS